MANSPGSDGAAEELHSQFACLRRELMELLDRKEEKIQQLIDTIPSHALPVATPPVANADVRDFSSMPPRQESAQSDASVPEFLKPKDGQERFSFESEAEKTKFASKATSGRTFRQEKGLRKYIQKGTHLGLFVDSTGCRPILEKAISKVEYLQKLHEPPRTNCLARMVDSSTFQFVCTVVILANCLTLLFSANWAMEHLSFDVPQYFRVLDLSFTSFYVIELILKLIVHRQYFFWHHDWRWNVFALFWCLVLVSLVICVFSLFFLQISTDYLILEQENIAEDIFNDFQKYFGSLDKTMQTLYLATTGGFDWQYALDLIGRAQQGGTWAFLFYIAFFNFAVFNVLTGMFVDHAMKWSQSDNQNQIAERRSQEQHDAARLKRLCEAIDVAKSGRISWDDFEHYVSNESALIYLASLGLEIHDAKTFFDMLIGVSDDKYVDIDTFVKGCMRMKGPATSIDMLSMGYEVTLIHRQNRRFEKALDELGAWQRKAQPMIDFCSNVLSI